MNSIISLSPRHIEHEYHRSRSRKYPLLATNQNLKFLYIERNFPLWYHIKLVLTSHQLIWELCFTNKVNHTEFTRERSFWKKFQGINMRNLVSCNNLKYDEARVFLKFLVSRQLWIIFLNMLFDNFLRHTIFLDL